MKKIFTLAAAALMSFGMWAAYPTATTTYALEDLTVTEATLTYEMTGLSGDAQKLNKVLYIDVEVPCATAHGNFFLRGTSSNTGRFATIWGNNGTERDESRKVAMKNGNSDPIAFTADDILEADSKYYIRFSSADNSGSYFDYKISGFSYVLAEECVNKEIISTEESLTAVTINDVAISATDLASLVSNKYLFLADAYVTAPVVKFTKHTVITYDDSSTKEKDEVIEVTSQPETTTWSASATINGNSYYVYTSKAASRTVTYMYGEQVLGTEIVAANGNPAEYAQYETMPLATFGGWYKDAELTQKVESMATEVISADVTFYADFTKAYAQSIDFEGMVIINGKDYDVKSALTANFYDYKTIDALDSLNNAKGAARNEPYLGLKIKKQGGYLACNVLPGTTIRIKFGYVGGNVLAIAGTDTMTLEPDNNKIADLEFPIMVETLVKLQTTSDKTVVIKQIKIDEPIETWMYPITYAEAEHGTVSGWTIAYPDEEVTVAIAPEAGYLTYSLTYNGVALHDDENTGAATFTMPAEDVTVAAEFVSEYPTAIENSEVEVKAVKVIRDGKLFIEKNGVLYDAQGTVVK
ncbi:MAG: InlB B-repeat-containing protein [Paludibacteraceae bacterium]|nr:InlB B-repeat-containing protein [Paludibacteraceae bacterium]